MIVSVGSPFPESFSPDGEDLEQELIASAAAIRRAISVYAAFKMISPHRI